MSSKIDGTTITLTRGDTLRVKVEILRDDEPYIPQEGDAVRFALRENLLKGDNYKEWADNAVLVKAIPTDTMVLQLDPRDTQDLGFGTYVYDVQITFEDGTVDTFITKAKLKLTEEVE